MTDSMQNYYFCWYPMRAHPNQVLTPAISLSGWKCKVDGYPAARLFATSINAQHELIRTEYKGGVSLKRDYRPEALTADFVAPEGVAAMVFGVWIHPKAFYNGIVYLGYASSVEAHPLTAGHLLDEALMTKVCLDPLS